MKKISLLLAVMFVMCGIFCSACEEKDTRVNATMIIYDNYDNEYEFTKENNSMKVTIPYDGLKRTYNAATGDTSQRKRSTCSAWELSNKANKTSTYANDKTDENPRRP